MNQENQVPNPTPVQNVPVKRKRGRPRKDDDSLRRVRKPARQNPGSEAVKRNPHRISNSPYKGDTMLGQVVSGVLDGSFEAGYLVTVKVGETNTILRGVLFNPSLVLPITEANDVASNVTMSKRNEISLGKPEKVCPPEVAQMSFNPTALKGVHIDINQVPQGSPQALQRAGIVGGRATATTQVVQPCQFKEMKLERKVGPSVTTLHGEVPNEATDGALKDKAVDLNALPLHATTEAVGDVTRKGENNNSLPTESQCVSAQRTCEVKHPNTSIQAVKVENQDAISK